MAFPIITGWAQHGVISAAVIGVSLLAAGAPAKAQTTTTTTMTTQPTTITQPTSTTQPATSRSAGNQPARTLSQRRDYVYNHRARGYNHRVYGANHAGAAARHQGYTYNNR
jgi:hypothetical protein